MSQIYGRGAVRLQGGRIVYHLGDRLLENGKDEGSLDDNKIVWTSDSRIDLSPRCHGPAMQGYRRSRHALSLAQ